jgi:hypothetical protein
MSTATDRLDRERDDLLRRLMRPEGAATAEPEIGRTAPQTTPPPAPLTAAEKMARVNSIRPPAHYLKPSPGWFVPDSLRSPGGWGPI